MKVEQQQIAKDLYFQTEKTQQEIADILDVNRRTVYLWVKNGKWEEMKQAVRQAPGLILQDIFNHIEAVNSKIRNREDHCPTMQEVDMLRKLLNMTKVIQKKNIGGYIESFMELLTYIMSKDLPLAQQVNKYADEYVKGNLVDKNFYYNDNFNDKDPERVRQTINNLKKMEAQAEPVITNFTQKSEQRQSDSCKSFNQACVIDSNAEAQLLRNTSSPSERSGEAPRDNNAIFSSTNPEVAKVTSVSSKPATVKHSVITSNTGGPGNWRTKYPIKNSPGNEIFPTPVTPGLSKDTLSACEGPLPNNDLPTAPAILSHVDGASPKDNLLTAPAIRTSSKMPVITIYTNSANNLNIASTDKISTITISDHSGQVIYALDSLDVRSLQVNMEAYPSGVYSIKINGSAVRRYMKQ